MSGTIFCRQSQHGDKTGSTYNFAIAKDRNIVPKPKWRYI